VVRYLDWLLDLGFALGIILSVKVKVLGGGFDLWLGDNIAILSMVKRAHLLFLTKGLYCLIYGCLCRGCVASFVCNALFFQALAI
jgi:hypothetical protein